MRSSDEVTLSSSWLTSSNLLLKWEKTILSMPLVVTHNRALLAGLGWQGPKAGWAELSYRYSDWFQMAGPYMKLY